MDIGTGIAIAGVWLFPAIYSLSKKATSFGFHLTITCAGVVTYIVL